MRCHVAKQCPASEASDTPPVQDAGPADCLGAQDERVFHQQYDRHWTMIWIATFVVITSFLLRNEGTDKLALQWLNLRLPEMCVSRSVFGVECPGCGLTRSFTALASGDLTSSFHFHRLGWLFAVAVVAQFPYRAYSLWQLRYGIASSRWSTWFARLLIAALIANWVLKVCGC